MRCGSWACRRCAAIKQAFWAGRVAEALPERLITFTHIPHGRLDIRQEFQELTRFLRGKGFVFEYWGVVELTKKGAPHLHFLQKGSYISKHSLQVASDHVGWGHCDIRRVTQGFGAGWYVGKHLCHSHGRRYPGRIIRYSRDFFPTTAKEYKKRNQEPGWSWRRVHGRADEVAQLLREAGETVSVGELGADCIMGEDSIEQEGGKRYSRDNGKGYNVSVHEVVKEFKQLVLDEGVRLNEAKHQKRIREFSNAEPVENRAVNNLLREDVENGYSHGFDRYAALAAAH